MSWNDLFVNMDNTNFFNFSFLPKYASAFLRGFEYTLLLAVVSVLLAVIPALLLALMRLSKNKLIRCISGAYIALFRSTPLLVQLSIIYFGLFHFINLPRTLLFGFIAINRFIPGVVALALNSSAYVAEIFRAGILAVDKGQTEAARSLGLSSWQSMRLVVLPCSGHGGDHVYRAGRVRQQLHHSGALCAGRHHLFLHQLSGLQGHRSHRKEDAPWRQAISSSPCSTW